MLFRSLENELTDPLLKNINFTFAGDLKTVESDQPESCPKASSSKPARVLNSGSHGATNLNIPFSRIPSFELLTPNLHSGLAHKHDSDG